MMELAMGAGNKRVNAVSQPASKQTITIDSRMASLMGQAAQSIRILPQEEGWLFGASNLLLMKVSIPPLA